MISLLDEIPLFVERITDKTTGFVTIAPLDDYPNGGDFEASVLPACFIGDSGDLYRYADRRSLDGLKDGFVFASIIVERKTGGLALSKSLMDAVANAILYEDGNNQRWYPDGFEYPFNLIENRPAALYYANFVMRNLIFTSQQALV